MGPSRLGVIPSFLVGNLEHSYSGILLHDLVVFPDASLDIVNFLPSLVGDLEILHAPPDMVH